MSLIVIRDTAAPNELALYFSKPTSTSRNITKCMSSHSSTLKVILYILNELLTVLRFKVLLGRSNKISPYILRGSADKSLALPGRKQATATKLGVYSTHSPRSSIHFLARCSNFCKLLKKIQNFVCPTRSPRQQRPPRRKKNGDLSVVFFFSPGNRW